MVLQMIISFHISDRHQGKYYFLLKRLKPMKKDTPERRNLKASLREKSCLSGLPKRNGGLNDGQETFRKKSERLYLLS